MPNSATARTAATEPRGSALATGLPPREHDATGKLIADLNAEAALTSTPALHNIAESLGHAASARSSPTVRLCAIANAERDWLRLAQHRGSRLRKILVDYFEHTERLAASTPATSAEGELVAIRGREATRLLSIFATDSVPAPSPPWSARWTQSPQRHRPSVKRWCARLELLETNAQIYIDYTDEPSDIRDNPGSAAAIEIIAHSFARYDLQSVTKLKRHLGRYFPALSTMAQRDLLTSAAKETISSRLAARDRPRTERTPPNPHHQHCARHSQRAG